MKKGVFLGLIILIVLLTIIGTVFLFLQGAQTDRGIPGSADRAIGIQEDGIPYINPEDGWKVIFPKDWIVEDMGYPGYVTLLYQDDLENTIEIYVDEFASEQDYNEEIDTLNILETKNGVFYIDPLYDDEDYPMTYKMYSFPKFYEIVVDVNMGSGSDSKRFKQSIDGILESFEMSEKSVHELREVNENDYNEKIRLRGSDGVVAAIVKCLDSPYFELRSYEEKISNTFDHFPLKRDTDFYRDFIYSGCALSEEDKLLVDVKEGGYCEQLFDLDSKIPQENRENILQSCLHRKESLEGQRLEAFQVAYTNLWKRGDLFYKSDGKDWEVWSELEDRSDAECFFEAGKCLYKFRNGELVTSK